MKFIDFLNQCKSMDFVGINGQGKDGWWNINQPNCWQWIEKS